MPDLLPKMTIVYPKSVTGILIKSGILCICMDTVVCGTYLNAAQPGVCYIQILGSKKFEGTALCQPLHQG